jgi:hypothetical protein
MRASRAVVPGEYYPSLALMRKDTTVAIGTKRTSEAS